MTIVAAADGSALKNPGPTGWAWAIDESQWRAGGFSHGTNNIGELYAVLDLLRSTAHLSEPLHILADSRYVIDTFTKWIHGWKRKGWKKSDGSAVLNVELIQQIDEALRGRQVTFEWVKGHNGHSLNEFVDSKARDAAKSFRDNSPVPSGPGLFSSLPPLGTPSANSQEIKSNLHLNNSTVGTLELDIFGSAPNLLATQDSIPQETSTQLSHSQPFPNFEGTSSMHAYKVHGFNVADHRITVPLNHANPSGQQITVFVREINDDPLGDYTKPALVFMQGGPGGRGPRPGDYRSGWIGEALKKYRVFLLDQRGTGLSTRLDEGTLSAFSSPSQQAAYLKFFRADSIVRDAEIVRHHLNDGKKWSSLGQSYGGFINMTYLSLAPEGLNEVFYTGGLPGLTSIDEIYQRTYLATAKINEAYFQRFPQDTDILRDLLKHLSSHEELLPNGERLTGRRLRMLGMMLGGTNGYDSLHYFFEGPFVKVNGEVRLSQLFLDSVWRQLSMGDSPLYGLMHETIYAGATPDLQGIPTSWAASRLLDRVGVDIPEGFAPNPNLSGTPSPIYLTGEHIYPWLFEEDFALSPLREAANLLATETEWPLLYKPEVLRDNNVPGAAAVYFEDMFVPTDLSLETANLAGIRTWVTNEYQHDGLRMDGARIFSRLQELISK